MRIGDILWRWLLQKPAQRFPTVFGFELQKSVLGDDGSDVRVMVEEALTQSLLILLVAFGLDAHEDVEERPVGT